MSLEITIGIAGMTCSSCSGSITDALLKHDGIEDVSISLLTEEGKIKFNHDLIDGDVIKQVIEDCGFDVRFIDEKVSMHEKIGHKIAADSANDVNENTYETIVSIKGMTCGACSASITNALEHLDGVESVSINLMTEDGKIRYNSKASSEKIIDAIADCGFEALIVSNVNLDCYITQSKFSITGMTCGSCSSSITKALEMLKGVEEVSVSLLTEEAMVIHNSQLVSTDKIKEAIEDCGFDANMLTSKVIDQFENDEETVALQIYGLTDEIDISHFQYNLEAAISSLGSGILDHKLTLGSNLNDSHDTNSSLNRTRNRDSDVYNEMSKDNPIDELSLTYDASMLGIRDIIERLDVVEDNVKFFILNSVDQLSNLQLELLSKVKEINYWRSNFLMALIIGLPIMILSKTQNTALWKTKFIFPGLFWTSLIQGVLSTYIQFKLGITFIRKFMQFVKNRGSNATMDVLVCISTSISYFFSVLAMIIYVWNGTTSRPPILLFETNAMLVTFISIGKWLENKAKGATSTALSKLLSLTPSSCIIVTDFEKYNNYIKFLKQEKLELKQSSLSSEEDQAYPTKSIEIDLIQLNDITIILPGSKIPADGEVIFGDSEVDESLLTGESLPIYKKVGDLVIGGSINGPGLLHVRVSRCGKNSQLQKVIKLVKESQISKAPVQRYSDYIASKFVPTVLILALLTFLFWVFYCSTKDEYLPAIFEKEENGKFFVCLKLSISVIVVACPCALGLASPTAIMVGTGLGAQHGVLIKGGDVLERANNLDILLFDKTGTITTGQMSLRNFKIFQRILIQDWWRLIGSIETNSEHPIGKALVKISRKELGLFGEDSFGPIIKNFDSLTGLGVKGNVTYSNNSYDIIVGNKRLIELEKIDVGDKLFEGSSTMIYVIINGEYYGYLELIDEIKPLAKPVINYLKHEKKYIVGMVTGDTSKVAEKIGQELGILNTNIFSEVSPVNKDKIVVDLRNKFGGSKNVNIAFIGDGINDAPALSQADIGIAISNGTDIAIESANMVIMNESNELLGVPIALDISSKTFRRIKINFLWAMIYNIIMVPFAMGCFLPFNIMLPPMAAGLSMAFSSISVVLSSLLLKNWKFNMKLDSKYDLESFDDFNLKDYDEQDLSHYRRSKRWL